MALWLRPNILLRLTCRKMKHLWIIKQAYYFSDNYSVVCVCKTKKIAIELCQSAGYKYSKKDDLWTNGEEWRTVEKIDYLDGG